MKIIDFEIEIPKYKSSTEIVVVGDIHRGNKFFDEPLWKRYYEGRKGHEGFKTDKNGYVITVGDLMETAMKDSLGVQDQSEWIEDQYMWVREQFAPLVADNRLIGMVAGNHERRATKNWFRTTRLMAKDFNIPYAEGILVTNLTLKKGEETRQYKIVAAHGYGGARTKGGKINSLMRLRDIVGDADVYICGHLHDKMAVTVPIFINGGTKDRLFGMTGAYLKYGGYGETRLYSPPARGSLKLKLHFDIDRVSGR